MSVLQQIITSLVAVSAFSLVGLIYFGRAKIHNQVLLFLVSFAAGTMLAAALFDLLPEAFEAVPEQAPLFIGIGIMLFLILEQLIHWHHHHNDHQCEDCPEKPLGYSVVIADALHNFLDGVVIASAYLVNPAAGISATIAVIAHELPQEFGDFSILLSSGFSRARAATYNLISALFALVGGLLTFYFAERLEQIIPYILAVGAGGFLYISLTDLLGEIKHLDANERIKHIMVVMAGMAVMYVVISYFHA